jgi:pyruvate kinase
MRKAKIICTLGPASSTEEVLEKMLLAGMNVARFNFSHGSHESHLKMIETFRAVRDRLGLGAAVLLDTKGPEIRLCEIENGKATLRTGDTFTITSRPVLGNSQIAQVNFPDLMRHDIRVGQNIKIDDGNIDLTVTERNETDLVCRINDGGVISTHKALNVPMLHLDVDFLSENDKSDLLFGIENKVDYVAASFVRSVDDVRQLREFLRANGGAGIKIISKIENMEGVENFDSILAESDGIMVARGDMGVEIDFRLLPGIQKEFIRKCNLAGKPVITATQMLESMGYNYMPTRAEITDVANAVFDGTSAVMLSGETTVGDYPVRVVEVMSDIVIQAEQDMLKLGRGPARAPADHSSVTEAVCDAAATTANDIKATAIIAMTESGLTAQTCSKFNPDAPIICATPNIRTFHQMSLVRGVYPASALYQDSPESMLAHAADCALAAGYVRKGDRIVIAYGDTVRMSGTTNTIKVETV